jgi:hypothetical protein
MSGIAGAMQLATISKRRGMISIAVRTTVGGTRCRLSRRNRPRRLSLPGCLGDGLDDTQSWCSVGNGGSMSSPGLYCPPQTGISSPAPLYPHLEHLAEARNWSLDVSGPHRMMATARASGDLYRHSQLSQWTHTQVVACVSANASEPPPSGAQETNRSAAAASGAYTPPVGRLLQQNLPGTDVRCICRR